MKKIVIFLILLVACQAFAQKSKVASFDFTHPQQLTPSIIPAESGGDVVMVTDTKFNDGKINISFSDGNQGTGVQILTDKLTHPGETVYYLRVTATASIIFSSVSGAVIDSIRFSDYTDPGDLYLYNNAPGHFDPLRGYKFWTADKDRNVTSVKFTNSYRTPRIEQVSVFYTEPSDVLMPLVTDINSGQTVSSFKELNMTFADNMSVLNAEGVTFASSDGSVSKKMQVSVNEKVVNLSLDTPVTTEGTYIITVPARSFVNSTGYENATLKYTVNVVTPRNTLTHINVSPEEGEIEKLLSGIILAYDKPIKVLGNPRIVLKQNGEDYTVVNIKRSSGNSKNAELTFDIPEGITEKGIYTIDVPENVVSDQLGNTYNPAFILTYKVGYTPELPAPVESETMKAAKALLLKTGVGYPAEDSDARKALAALTTAADTPGDEELQAAIETFYNETNVEMPVSGKFYNIASVNADGQKLYIVSTDGGVTFSRNVAQATAFEANGSENVTFTTIDGKYLYVKGITDDEEIKVLTLAKIGTDKIKEEVEVKQLLGLMSIYGTYKNAEGDILSPCGAWVSHENNTFITDASTNYLHFTSGWSSAFLFTETEKPSEEQVVDAEYTITPDVVKTSKEVLTLTFTDLDDVALSNRDLAYFANSSGDVIENADIYSVSDKKSQFTIRLGNFSNGDYTIVLPEGTFTYVNNGVTFKVGEISKNFKIGENSGSGDDEGFSYTYNSFFCYKFKDIQYPVKDIELNEFIVYIYPEDYTDLVADPNKIVKLVRYNNIYDVRREGYFEKYQIPEYPEYPALKLILKEPIKAGDLKADMYGFLIPQGSIGDANFGKYLADKTSISPSECKVNRQVVYPIQVDNSYTTGIDEISGSDNSVDVIYDLTGRRVASMDKPGVYIVNGRKVVRR